MTGRHDAMIRQYERCAARFLDLVTDSEKGVWWEDWEAQWLIAQLNRMHCQLPDSYRGEDPESSFPAPVRAWEAEERAIRPL